MTCKCGGSYIVIDSRSTSGSVRRRRKCSACGERISTHEYSETEIQELKSLRRKYLKLISMISSEISLLDTDNLLDY